MGNMLLEFFPGQFPHSFEERPFDTALWQLANGRFFMGFS